jgi:hypothetical protein
MDQIEYFDSLYSCRSPISFIVSSAFANVPELSSDLQNNAIDAYYTALINSAQTAYLTSVVFEALALCGVLSHGIQSRNLMLMLLTRCEDVQ